MKKFNLLFLLASLFAVGGAKAQAYEVSDLITAGWEEVTSLEQDNATVSQYVYVFYSVEGENLMLAYDKGTPTRQNTWTAVYHTAKNPFVSAHMVWLLDYNAQYHYALKSAFNSTYFMQSHRNAAHRVCIDFETAHTEWDDWDITYDAKEKWTIRNSVSGAINGNKDLYIGPWDPKSFIDGSEVAGNKSGNDVGHFRIYRMLKTDYDVKKAAYLAEQTQFLTDNDWDEVTTSIDNDDLSQYFYVFYSVEGENLMLAQDRVTGYQGDELTGVYHTAANPIENSQMVWTLDYNNDFLYGFRCVADPTYYMQSRGSSGGYGNYNIQMFFEKNQSEWTRFNLAYSDNSWTIENRASNYSGTYIGPWDEDASSFSDGKAVAGNKTGDYVGHFKLYRMKKAVYYGKKYYPEFTAVTSTDQLTDENMAANYFIFVDQTQSDLVLRLKTDGDVSTHLYYNSQNVLNDLGQVWTLEPHSDDAPNGEFSMRNMQKDHVLLQTEYIRNTPDDGAFCIRLHDQPAPCEWTKLKAESDGRGGFTIANTKYPGKYIGLWTPSNGYHDGQSLAANKTADSEKGHYFIYYIPRSEYQSQYISSHSEITNLVMVNPYVGNDYGWEGTKNTFDRESFTGAPDNICLDLNNNGKTYQFVTLPAGHYLIKVATRGILNANAGIYVKLKNASPGDDLVNVQVQKKDKAGNELGNGWGWTYLPFSIAEEKELEIGFFVESGDYAGADDFHLYKGVVTMNENNTSVDFSAGEHANVVMNRNIKAGKWATLCLPFDLGKPDGWEVRELSSVEESDGVYTLHFTEAASLEAGKPYMVKTAEDVTRIVATDVTVLTEPVDQTVDGVTMKGVFISGYVPSGGYFVSGNKFYRAADESNTLKAFRAYFEINDSPEARSLILNIDEATSVTTLEGQQPATEQPEAVFDLSGRRQTRLVPGINIVRQADGTVKKVFVK